MLSRNRRGFTIVELLIVIVIIGILAAISIVSYNGIQNRAWKTMLTSDLKNASTQLALHYVDNGVYPALLAETNGKGIKASKDVTYQYAANNSSSVPTYCLTATIKSITFTVGADTAAPLEGTCSGLLASYFSNVSLSGVPTIQQMESTVNYSWGLGTPNPSIPADSFSVRWTGFVTAPSTGTYTFYVTSDDGERLSVNNVLLVDKWVPQGDTTWTGTIYLVIGQKVPIVYETFESGGGATARLEWMIPGGSQVTVPASALSQG